jgi:hypothetical protein
MSDDRRIRIVSGSPSRFAAGVGLDDPLGWTTDGCRNAIFALRHERRCAPHPIIYLVIPYLSCFASFTWVPSVCREDGEVVCPARPLLVRVGENGRALVPRRSWIGAIASMLQTGRIEDGYLLRLL